MNTKLIKIITLLFVFTSYFLYSSSEYLKLIKTIGDERENYTFFLINSSVLSENKDIFISDVKGHFVAKYNWNGKFIKKIGKKGKGPGDFLVPSLLNAVKNKVLVYDGGNKRIVEIDDDLENLKYYRMSKSPHFFSRKITDLKNGLFLGSITYNIYSKEVKERLRIFDKNGETIHKFFEYLPMKDTRNFSNPLSMMYLETVFSTDQNKEKLIISFNFPDNPVEFYIYTSKGKYINKFSFKIDKEYRFPKYRLQYPPKYPSESYYSVIDSLFIYKENYIFFIIQIGRKKKEVVKDEYMCYIVDKFGNLKHKFKLSDKFRFFYISEEGYLLGKNFDSDMEKLLIYQVNL